MSDRRKQIKDAASRHLCDNCHHEWCSVESFVSGCEWADTNPSCGYHHKLDIAIKSLEVIASKTDVDCDESGWIAREALKKIKGEL